MVSALALSASRIRRTAYFANDSLFSFRRIEVTRVRRLDATFDLACREVDLAEEFARE
jgi:hypothetical protein